MLTPKDIVREQLEASVEELNRSSQSQNGCAPKSATSGSEPSAAFTPGPWITETTARFVWIGPPKASGAKVADVVTGLAADGLTDQAEVRVFANARLIAAAPDLLACCQEFISRLGDGGYYPTIGKPATDRMRAAIAKATGQ